MNYKHQENRALTGPLIFAVPASHFPFLVALNIGWLDVTERSAEEKRRTHNLTVATQRLDSATSEVHDSRYRVELKTARAYAAGWAPEGKESRDGPVE